VLRPCGVLNIGDADFAYNANMLSIQTPRLTIRRFQPSDLEPFVAYRNLPEVARWQTWTDYPLERGKQLLAELETRESFTPDKPFQLAVQLENTLIGDLYCKLDSAGQQAEIGFSFAPAFQGKGYASEAVRGLLGHLFTVVGLHRVFAITDPHNTASRKLLERVGMRLEGHMKESLWFKGEWADDLFFAILHREFSKP
jgi:RimJ/RimL family protein N-acetyltransferase